MKALVDMVSDGEARSGFCSYSLFSTCNCIGYIPISLLLGYLSSTSIRANRAAYIIDLYPRQYVRVPCLTLAFIRFRTAEEESTSSITTEFPLMTCGYQTWTTEKGRARRTTMPIRTFSPPAFSSMASSRTMFRKTWVRDMN